MSPKLVTPKTLKACYAFLRVMAFDGCKLPSADRIRFIAKPLPKHHGYYLSPRTIAIDTGTATIGALLKVMAHEMSHLVLDKTNSTDHHKHDNHFKALANIICQEMGWPRGSV